MLEPVVRHRDLFEDHVLFHVELFGRQRRLHHVGQQLDLPVDVALRHPPIVERSPLRRERVVRRAHLVEVDVDPLPGPLRRPLEAHVLEEVRHAGQLARLVAAARSRQKPRRRRPHVRHDLDHDPQTVVQLVSMKRCFHAIASLLESGYGTILDPASSIRSPTMKHPA